MFGRGCRHEYYTVLTAYFFPCDTAGCDREKHKPYSREMARCLACGMSATHQGSGWDYSESTGPWKLYTLLDKDGVMI